MGLHSLPKSIRTYVLTRRKKLDKLAQLGASVDASQQEQIVRGALLSNVAAGKDQAANSLKMLGQDKRVGMFTPDSVTGVVVIEVPRSVPTLDQVRDYLPTIDAAALPAGHLPESTT